jgi:hypothetical protein
MSRSLLKKSIYALWLIVMALACLLAWKLYGITQSWAVILIPLAGLKSLAYIRLADLAANPPQEYIRLVNEQQ